MGLNNVTGWNYMGNLWVPPQQNEVRMRINWNEMNEAVTNAVKQENGLWKVKLGNNPATAFFSKEQAQNFARQQYFRSIEGPSVFNARPTAIQQPVIQQPTVQPTAVRQPVIQQPTVQPTMTQQQYFHSITSQPTAFNMQPTAAQQQYVRSTTAQPTAAKQPIVQQPTAQPTASLQPQTNNTAQITQRKKHTWANYAQEHGTTYTKPPKSGVVIADERAAQIIAQNAEKAAQQPVIQQPIAQPAAAQQQYFNSITSQPTAAKQPVVQQPIAQPTAAQQPVVQQPTAQPAAAQQSKANEPGLASEAEAKAKQVKTPEQRAAQLRRVRSNPRARSLHKRLKLKNNPELAERYKSHCKSVKNTAKLKGLKKAGKWGALAALAIGAVTAITYACKGDKKDDAVKPETTQPAAPAEQTPAAPATPAETAPTTPAEPTNTEEIGVGEFRNGKYKVQKGDCFWNIAKQNLIEEYKKAQTAKNEAIDENYMPTDAEILKETERLVEKNDYEFDSRHWNTTKPIYEGDILNIAA